MKIEKVREERKRKTLKGDLGWCLYVTLDYSAITFSKLFSAAQGNYIYELEYLGKVMKSQPLTSNDTQPLWNATHPRAPSPSS